MRRPPRPHRFVSRGPKRQRRAEPGHPKIVACLVGFGTLLAVFAIFSIWANRQALNTDNWVTTSDRILQNQEVQSHGSPPSSPPNSSPTSTSKPNSKGAAAELKPLAGPAAGGLQPAGAPGRRTGAGDLAGAGAVGERQPRRPRIAARTARRRRHDALDRKRPGDARPRPAARTGRRPDRGRRSLAAKLPADAGRLTILHSDRSRPPRTSPS